MKFQEKFGVYGIDDERSRKTDVYKRQYIILDGGAVVFFHDGTADTASDARGHFNKAMVKVSVFDIAERGNTVLHSVDSEICVARLVLRHCLEDSACRGEESRAAVVVFLTLLFQLAMLGVKPSCKLLKGEYGVDNAFVVVGFVLFCNAGTDEHGFGVGKSLLDVYKRQRSV